VTPKVGITDGAGVATATFVSTTPCTATITAFVDVDEDGVKDAGEATDTATKEWKKPLPTACVKDSGGSPIAGVPVKYKLGASTYSFGTTGADGCVVKDMGGSVTSVEVWPEYHLGSQHLTQDFTTDPFFDFQTVKVTLRLENCDGDPLDTGKPRYGAGATYTTAWFPENPGQLTGSSNPGEVNGELFTVTYSFEMQYKTTAETKLSQVIPAGGTTITWKTTAVTLTNSGGGAISYGGTGGDSTFFTKPTMELLAVTNLNVHFRDPGGGVVQLTWGPCVSCPCTFSYIWVP
jgi:hypothetical protein